MSECVCVCVCGKETIKAKLETVYVQQGGRVHRVVCKLACKIGNNIGAPSLYQVALLAKRLPRVLRV